MKFIFDFDNVLFNTTSQLKPRIFSSLAEKGIQYSVAEEFYKKVRGGEFSLKNFISDILAQEGIKKIKMIDVYEDIMSFCPLFINKELAEVVRKLGKENCYLVTYGEQEFNQDKVKRSGLASLFREVFVVSDSKKEVIENICAQHKGEEVIFVDDLAKHFEGLDMAKCPNLKTVLYDENGLEKLISVISQS